MPILGVVASSKLSAVPGDFQYIDSYTVSGGSTNTITFSSIPATFTHLQIRGVVRSGTSGYYDNTNIRFNGSSGGTAYNMNVLRSNGSTAQSATYINQSQAYVEAGYVACANTTTGTFSPIIMDLYDYTDTNKYRNGRLVMGYENNGSGGDNYDKGMQTTQYWNWQSSAAIYQIAVSTTTNYWVAGSTLALYGIKG